ncbi:hypothetical protein MKK88_10140 [Methylobacterium sp. E-005]|uniref:hypothetical protein n=1 Tax=Methylobacterium sp. E-005 TaxID=2836549 RepID=UPI001FBA5618|nr:hypothetical protein [Methylobacterium sp. E-005]MCJ2086349.1 hypothetical protein [Methylobacterium sp. E-005]
MPHGARTSLAALILLLGVGGATAEPAAGTTWTDPPTHKPAAEAPAPERKASPAPAPSSAKSSAPSAATPPAASTPAAVAEAARPARTPHKAARRAPTRIAAGRAAPKRRVAETRRPRIAAAPPRAFTGPRIAVAPSPPPEGYVRYRPYGYGPGYGPGYADERLDRLSSAEAAGYVVVHRRTVLFPDGRTLRVYRPDDGEPF